MHHDPIPTRAAGILAAMLSLTLTGHALATPPEPPTDPSASPPAASAEPDADVEARAGGSLGHAPGGAEDEGVLRPSSRAAFAAFGLGPSFGLTACGDGGCGSTSNVTQIKLGQEIGYHVSGRGDGFAIGASIEEAFGDNLLRLQPGVKLWWDIQPSQNLALYIAPTLKLGYAYFSVDAGPFGSADDHAFNAQVGVEGRIVLEDRGMIFLRPFTLDTFTNDDGVLLTYDLMFGGAVTF